MSFRVINDVKIQQKRGTMNLPLIEKEFEIDYIQGDVTVFFEFINVPVKDAGDNWIIVVRHVDQLFYRKNKEWFAQAASDVLNKIVPFLEEEYQFVPPERVLFDHESSVYALN